jgi:hypothetical protein
MKLLRFHGGIIVLSKAESNYLKNPDSVSPGYAYVLKHRIAAKLAVMNQEIDLINDIKLTDNCKNLTEFRKTPTRTTIDEITANQVAFIKSRAPRMGFEPMRNGCSTGSQGPRVNHSATSAL